MKKLGLILIGMSTVFLYSACTEKNGDTVDNAALSDYKPMIYVQDNLYGETGDKVSTLPDGMIYIGDTENVVPQNEPMVQENFTSNTLPVGSEVYYDELNPDIIYVKHSGTAQEAYLKYELME